MSKRSLLKSIFLSAFFLGVSTAEAQTRTKADSDVVIFGKKYTNNEIQENPAVVKCASTEYEARLQAQDPGRMTDAQFEAWLAPLVEKAKMDKSQNNGIITIPVVVHVIHSGQPVGFQANISDNQVISQITAMNNDYRKVFGSRGDNTDPVGADIMIQFALAKVDPNGNPTNGIDRVNLCQTSWNPDDVDVKVKPQTIWDPNSYLNMWTVNFSVQGLLGYAQFPSGSGLAGMPGNGGAANSDGVVAGYRAFGSSDFNDGTFNLMPGSDLGRTMTHEVGHFLGLRHLWGDGGCTVDDFCNDTPNSSSAGNAQYNCNDLQDSCPSSPGLDMVRNYMNYTNDFCMNIFTNDQKARIVAVMNNSPRRASLKTSTKDVPIALFPNDAEVKIENVCAGAGCDIITNQFKLTIYNRGTSTLSSAVINYSFNGGPNQVYNWTGSLLQDKSSTVTVSIPTGTVLTSVSASIQTVNGVADQRATNNTDTKAFGAPVYPFTTVVFRLQQDIYGDETSWEIRNGAGTILYSGGPYADTSPTMPALITQTWTLPLNDCYTFKIFDSFGDGINSGYGAGYFDIKSQDGTTVIYSGGSFEDEDRTIFKLSSNLATSEALQAQFEVYPNPAKDVLNVTKVSNRALYTIYSSIGQVVAKGKVQDNKVNVSGLATGAYIITVSDGEFSGNVKFIKR
ncbi:T9SS type A sorting domain-containing protein [Marnyiella aurantia]|uniref:T9SS type A sorting domain-containing protein n=1 Tax=Marnyiella aurantia TaxID=2758037 RepID=A0A7D7LS15_9FLAO|nr:M43 family zinc metalloprotease [Marnyiella aurantia]MBA5247893.1 T9SS type A sorting domain-containing protein [Marnyiella aurantia]QMS99514.1 T9SS type A sorting domain-containing protein [Marnyiella aurantia]